MKTRVKDRCPSSNTAINKGNNFFIEWEWLVA